jgi:hypothetical protein
MTQGVVQALFGMMREAMGFQLTNFQTASRRYSALSSGA